MAETETISHKARVQDQFGATAAAYVASAGHAAGDDLAQLVAWNEGGPEKAALDVATGGGHTALALAAHYGRVVASDLTAPMLAAAEGFIRGKGIANVDFRLADAEALPFGDAEFDAVSCRIAPHHFPDPARFVAEVARVLKPGGLFFYDTINRTFMSNVVTIKVLQEWSLTATMPPRLHDWRLFIKPGELVELMGQRGIVSREVVGLKSMLNPLAMIAMLRSCKRGEISYAEAGRRAQIRADKDVSVSYMGYGTKS